MIAVLGTLDHNETLKCFMKTFLPTEGENKQKQTQTQTAEAMLELLLALTRTPSALGNSLCNDLLSALPRV